MNIQHSTSQQVADDLPRAPAVMSLPMATTLALLSALIISSFISLEFNWQSLLSVEALRSSWEFLRGFAPPESSPAFLKKVALATFETLAMSALGTVIAAIFGLMLALPASGRWGRLAHFGSRLFLNMSRAIPELVWASMMLIAAGLGPFAGTIALALHTTGVLGRLFAETLENAPRHNEVMLQLNGASQLQSLFYATLPQSMAQLMSYTLYRWENNIRAASILGMVGAGGLGQMLKYHLSLFQMQSAASIVIAMLLLVGLVDALSYKIRHTLMK